MPKSSWRHVLDCFGIERSWSSEIVELLNIVSRFVLLPKGLLTVGSGVCPLIAGAALAGRGALE